MSAPPASAACRHRPAHRPLRLASALVLLPLLLLPARPALATEATHAFGPSSGEILIHTGRGGLLGFAGHRHLIRARSFEGTLAWPPDAEAPAALSIRIDAASLTVEDDDLDAEDVAKVQADMEGKVLEVAAFPSIGFTANGFEPDGDRFRVTGELELHGVRREISFPLEVTRSDERVLLSGELRVRQSDHGIDRVSVALGSVKVKDEVRVEIRIDAAPAPPLDDGATPPAR